jgi:predicted secreted Zn-dependent protease
MKLANWFSLPALAACLFATSLAARAEGQVIEQVKTYAITGKSGIELYTSIGQQGPKVGNQLGAIAHTNFKLTWSRKYEPQGGGCTLVSARPKLIITYTLPKPSEDLPAATAKRWEVFIEGIRRHEAVHGAHIREMVKTIEKTTIGVSVAGDPGCRKIREEIKTPLSQASLDQRQKSREFDRIEMSDGGNIHRLILQLVNER